MTEISETLEPVKLYYAPWADDPDPPDSLPF